MYALRGDGLRGSHSNAFLNSRLKRALSAGGNETKNTVEQQEESARTLGCGPVPATKEDGVRTFGIYDFKSVRR